MVVSPAGSEMLYALSVLSCLAILQVNTAATQCIQDCPMDSIPGVNVQLLTLRPGEHRVLCFDYQYYKLADEEHVALFDNNREFCSTANEFLDPGSSNVSGIECSVFNVNTTNSPCSHFAVAVRCEWSEDNESILSSSEYLRLALQLESTNIMITGYERCNVILNVSWENVGECTFLFNKV